MIKHFLSLVHSLLLLSSLTFLCTKSSEKNLQPHAENTHINTLDNESKKSFIQFLYAIQDYNLHAKSLISIINNDNKQFAENKKTLNQESNKEKSISIEIKQEIENYRKQHRLIQKTIQDVADIESTLNSNDTNYQQQIQLIKNLKNTLETDKTKNNTRKTHIENLQKEQDNLITKLNESSLNGFYLREKLKTEATRYRDTLKAIIELDKDSNEYQTQMAYINKLVEEKGKISTLKDLENPLNYNKLIYLTEALYLTASNNTLEQQKNKDLSKKLSLLFHPDKNNKQTEQINTLIFNDMHQLLITNKPTDSLNSLIDPQNTIIPDPSFMEQTIAAITLPFTAFVTHIVGYKTVENILPHKVQEAQLYQKSKASSFGNLLILHNKLFNLQFNSNKGLS